MQRRTLSRVLRVIAFGCLTSWALPCLLRAQAGVGAGGRTPATVQRAAGCYQLTTGAWSGQLPSTGLPEARRRPPAWFALDTVPPAPPSNGAYAVHPTTLTPRAHMLASWTPVGADSVSIVWSTGFMGVALRVAVRGDSLIGIARTFQDAHHPGDRPAPQAPVVAVRVPCPPGSRERAG